MNCHTLKLLPFWLLAVQFLFGLMVCFGFHLNTRWLAHSTKNEVSLYLPGLLILCMCQIEIVRDIRIDYIDEDLSNSFWPTSSFFWACSVIISPFRFARALSSLLYHESWHELVGGGSDYPQTGIPRQGGDRCRYSHQIRDSNCEVVLCCLSFQVSLECIISLSAAWINRKSYNTTKRKTCRTSCQHLT